ncbi:MAG: hypothetical protein ABI411_02115 [Tahibacter sp.]
MRTSRLAAVLMLFSANAGIAAGSKAQLEVEMGGKSYPVDAEGFVDIPQVDAGALRLRVREKENVQLRVSGLGFDVPRGYRLEHDPTPPESWTFDGDETMLTVYRNEADDPQTPAQFLAEMLRIGGHVCVPEAISLHAAAHEFPGSVCDVVHGEIRTRREVYLIAAAKARWMFSFMLVRSKDKPPSTAWAQLKRQVSTTLTLEKP